MIQSLDHNPTLTRQRLGEQVATLLLNAIDLHEYLPGERLPSERDLCERLSVNRTALRDGLRILELRGLVQVRRGKYGGAFVLPSSPDLALERVRARSEDLRQLLEFRSVIEPLVTAMAASAITEQELAQLSALHGQERTIIDAAGGVDELRAIDREFHRVIGAATGNKRMLDVMQAIRIDLSLGLNILGWSAPRRHESFLGHEEIIDALGRHDPGAAASAMERHVAATRVAIVDALAERGIDLEYDSRTAFLWRGGGFLAGTGSDQPA